MFPLRLVFILAIAIIPVTRIEPRRVRCFPLIVSITRTYFEKNRVIEAIPTIIYMENCPPNKL